MSTIPLFLEDYDEVEMSFDELVGALKTTLDPVFEAEIEAIEKEVAFLRGVYDGITGGSALEIKSTIVVDSFLSNFLEDLGFPS